MPEENVTTIDVDAGEAIGPLELWRHSVGHGGINTRPLPDRVVEGLRRLKPRLIRIFIQEFFRIYEGEGRFDWSRLDPYMDSFAATGAKVVAAITIKPAALYPEIDQLQWRPRDAGEWQDVIRALVRRYSVERPTVTHWEIGNEPDIGEDGGCPYLITDPEEYGKYYGMTVRPILEAFPDAKVGGPALASGRSPLLPGLLDYCGRNDLPLDFVSWHLYHDDPAAHAGLTNHVSALLGEWPGKRPEMLVTEWSRNFPPVSVEDDAFEPRRAAIVAASIIEMRRADLDWSFYYHIRDQVCFPSDFEPFFSDRGVGPVMVRHWNEVPHRFGLFGVCGEVRPQYFVYRMLAQMGEEQLTLECGDGLRALAGRGDGGVSVLLVNENGDAGRDRTAVLRFANLSPGLKRLTVWRIDGRRAWSNETLELHPVERRDLYALSRSECHVHMPADSVALVSLSDTGEVRAEGD
jgi:hypothetical protein